MSEGNIGNLGGIETADLETVEDEEKQYEIIKQGTVREISPLNVEAAAYALNHAYSPLRLTNSLLCAGVSPVYSTSAFRLVFSMAKSAVLSC